jgi:DNA-binding PadR family transcriptional regulator
MTTPHLLGELEQLVLLAVARLGADGYGVTIRREIERRGGREVSVGAVYVTLERLEEKGLVASFLGEASPKRGGRARRHYRLETAGAEALTVARRRLEKMWEDLDVEGRRAPGRP